MKHFLFFILIWAGITPMIKAQLTPAQYAEIDSLFTEWNSPNHPGGTVGIMRGGQVVFSKAYGLASLEYLVPNSTGTLFNVASVSKQFTAMGIVMLHLAGELSVDDDIRIHLPDLPDFGDTVTIRHMLHHTSGLRSLHALLALAGWREDDARTDADLFRFMVQQKELNFKPGEEYLYCNTGYIFMARIIEKVTGESFPTWMKKFIFEPLGMTHTYVEDKYMRVVPQNATSYYGSKWQAYERAVEYWGYMGSGNMHSTTTDLLKWLRNFYDPQPGWEAPFDMLQTQDPFNNGKENPYAFGVDVREANGYKRIGHGGAIGGFRSFIGTYPEKELSIVVLGNFSSSSTGRKADLISAILLGKEEESEEEDFYESLKTVRLSNEDLTPYEGYYWSDKTHFVRKIYLRNDTLRYYRTKDSESPLVPIGPHEFQMWEVYDDIKLRFESDSGGKKALAMRFNGGAPDILKEFEQRTLTQEEVSDYTGNYYSPELETTYRIYKNEERLYWHHARHGDFEMSILKPDVLEAAFPFSIVKFQRNEEGIITGIRVSNGRVRNLWFERLPTP